MKKGFTIAAVILVTIALCGGLLVYGYLNSFSKNGDSSKGNFIKPKEIKVGEPFNILLLGVDIGTAGSKNSPTRSDTMVVFHYDPASNDMAMVSIPRDTKVSLNGSTEKINAANAFGGTNLAIKTVEKLLGINVNYYVEINYQGFRKFIDAIGGVDVIIPLDMYYDDNVQNLHIHFKKNQNVHLDGQKAEEFVRWRKNNDGTGYPDADLGRIKTQQDFMVKVIEKVKSPAMITKAYSIAKMLPEYIDTNMEPMTMLGLAKDVLPKMNLSSIQKYTLQGEAKTIDKTSYFIYDANKSKDIVALLGGSVQNASNKVENKNIKIQIMNGSGVNGAAAKAKEELEKRGYTVTSTGNIAGLSFAKSHIIDKTLKGNNAKQVGNDLEISNIAKDQDNLSPVDIVVVLGSDKKSYFD